MKTIGRLCGLVLVAAASIGAGCDSGNQEDGQIGAGYDSGNQEDGQVEGNACSGTTVCGPDEYCDSILWTCKEGVQCQSRPSECTSDAQPVCACDGKVYEDVCAAIDAGIGLAASNVSCPVPEGRFRCGYALCKTGVEACRINFEVSYECQPLPAECQVAGADCTCLGYGAGGADGQGGGGQGPIPGCGACYERPYGLELRCSFL